jgi:hypothetical protein
LLPEAPGAIIALLAVFVNQQYFFITEFTRAYHPHH